MKLGTENKKATYALAVLSLGALYGIYNAFFSGPSSPTPSTPVSAPAGSASVPPPTAPRVATAPPATTSTGTARTAPGARSDEFKPRLRSKRAEDQIDVTTVDPTLRLDVLPKLDKVPAPAGQHNLFQMSAPPPPVLLAKNEPTVKIAPHWGPAPLPPPPPPPAPPPPKPIVPINVKYWGWAAPSGTARKRAFFLDPTNNEMLVAYEGDKIKGHYQVVRITDTTVVVEDLDDKKQQTLTKEEGA